MIFVAILMMAGFSMKVMAQTSATLTTLTAAGAQLIVPMTIGEDAPLHFGTINLLTGVAGTVVLSTQAGRSVTGGVALSAVTPTATNAAYHVAGTYNETYALTLPSSITVTETVGSSATMTISLLKARFNGAGADAVTSKLSALGVDNFTVGGTLTVGTSQLGGIYAGIFNISVDYN